MMSNYCADPIVCQPTLQLESLICLSHRTKRIDKPIETDALNKKYIDILGDLRGRPVGHMQLFPTPHENRLLR